MDGHRAFARRLAHYTAGELTVPNAREFIQAERVAGGWRSLIGVQSWVCVEGAGRACVSTVVAIMRAAPAAARAAVTGARICSVTRASMTPPQPAPDSLAPSAPAPRAALTRRSSSGDETPICWSRA